MKWVLWSINVAVLYFLWRVDATSGFVEHGIAGYLGDGGFWWKVPLYLLAVGGAIMVAGVGGEVGSEPLTDNPCTSFWSASLFCTGFFVLVWGVPRSVSAWVSLTLIWLAWCATYATINHNAHYRNRYVRHGVVGGNAGQAYSVVVYRRAAEEAARSGQAPPSSPLGDAVAALMLQIVVLTPLLMWALLSWT